MNINELRNVVKRIVRKQLKEAASTADVAPKTFKDFRRIVSGLLRDAGAPEDLVEEVSDMGNEGGEVVSATWDAWNDFSQDASEDEDWREVLSWYATDMVLDIVDAYSNPMNYEPGWRGRRVDGKTLADKVVSFLTSKGRAHGDGDTPDRELRDMADLVTDVLEQCGCAENIKWDGKNTVTYTITTSNFEFYEEVQIGATGPAGLTLVKEPDTYRDDITGLTVKFDDDFATIS